MAGLTIGLLVNNIKHIALSGLVGCVFAMSFLIVMGMEGIFCALMAAPLAMAAMIVAGLLVHVAKIIFKKDEFNSGKHLAILLLFSPLLVAGVDKAEEPRRASPAAVTISDSIRIAATADRIWETLGPFESMDGAKPFLLQLGALPVLRRCTLEGRAEAVSEPVILTRALSCRRSPRGKSQAGWNSKSPATPCRETNG